MCIQLFSLHLDSTQLTFPRIIPSYYFQLLVVVSLRCGASIGLVYLVSCFVYHNWSLMEMHPSMMLPCTSYCGVLNTPTIIIILSIHLDEEDIDKNVRIL